MRQVFAICFAVSVASCNQSAISPEIQHVDCETIWDLAIADGAEIGANVNIKRSHEMELAASLAFHYGAETAKAENVCSIPIDSAPIFDPDMKDTGGLKEKSTLFIMASESVGRRMADDRDIALSVGGFSTKDSDRCLQAIHDMPKARDNLRKFLPVLIRLGY